MENKVETYVILHAQLWKPLCDLPESLMSLASKAIHGQGSCFSAICDSQP